VYRQITGIIWNSGIRTLDEQGMNDFPMTISGGLVGGYRMAGIQSIRVRPRVQKNTGNFPVTGERYSVERCEPSAISGIHHGPVLEEQFDYFGVSSDGGLMQRRLVQPIVDVHLNIRLDKPFDCLNVTRPRSLD